MEFKAPQDTRGFAVWCKRPFDYNGQSLDRGQIFKLIGGRNDEALIRLGYVGEVEKSMSKAECNQCGGIFIDPSYRDRHGRTQHPERRLTPMEEDERAEREERELETVAPLNLDKTKARTRK